MQSIRVMIVDDRAIVVEALERLLQTEPRLTVRGRARSLAEAKLLLTRLTPDVIVLDLGLPDSQGYATITVLRACCPGARIVVLTGSPGVTAEQVRRYGADAYLDKRTESARIVDTIRDVAALTPTNRATPELLTPREADVARLAAEGLTNAEIGRALHISRNTVKTHLARVLAKRGFRSRTDLAAHWHKAGQVS